jgi:hypothetical protein
VNRWLSVQHYAKTTIHPFVSRLRFRAAAIVLRNLGHLADARHSLELFKSFKFHSHLACGKGRREVNQYLHVGLCGDYGRKLYSLNDSRRRDGSEIRTKSAGSDLLPDGRRGGAVDFCSYGHRQMNSHYG